MVNLTKTTRQFLKYGIVGFLNVGVAYLVFLLVLRTGANYPYALFAGHLVGVVHSYVWNKWWTFEAFDTRVRREFLIFFFVYLGTFILNLGLLTVLVELIEMKTWLAQLILIGVITALNFIGHKYWSFQPKGLSRDQRWALLLGGVSLLVIGIMALPYFMLQQLVQDPLALIPDVNDRTSAELFYFSYSQEVVDGYPLAGDPFSYEHRLETYVRPPVFTTFYGEVQWLLGLSAEKTYLFLNLFSAPLLFGMVYLFLRRFHSVSRWLALFGGLAFLFGLEMLWDRWALLPDFLMLFGVGPSEPPIAPLEISRLPSPTHTLLFYVATLYTAYRGLFEENRRFLWLTGLLVGLSFYLYFYLWMLWLIYFPLLFAVTLLQRNSKRLKSIAMVLGIGLVLSIPYWINMSILQSKDYFEDLGIRTGILYGHSFYFTPMEWAILLLMFVFYPWRDRHFLFLITLILAMMVGENLQVILGYNVFPDSWWGKFIRPTVLLLLTLLIPYTTAWISSRFRWVKWSGGFLVAVTFLINAVYIQLFFPINTQAAFRSTTDTYAAPLQWMEDQLPPDSVVLGLSTSSSLLPVYTHAYPYFPYGLSLQTDEEIVDRLLITARLLGWSDEMLRAYLSEKKYTDYLFAYKYNKSGFAPDVQPLAAEEIESMVAQYQTYTDLSSLLERYRLDYLFIGPEERAWTVRDFEQDPSFTRLYDDGTCSLYYIKRSSS